MTDLIERELELPAPPEAVWEVLTDPGWLQEWLADEVSLQLSPGGDARFRIGEETRNGWVEEVTPPSEGATGRLAFWWETGGGEAGDMSRVALELTHLAQGTRLRVVESRPLDVLDLVGTPLGGHTDTVGDLGGERFGPALVAA
jgi:uncharacterized protein YndB with AHSA1/START domain